MSYLYPASQTTLKNPICMTGITLHAGQSATLMLLPADINQGISFYRTDLDIGIEMNPFLMTDTLMSSNLVQDDVKIGTIEHLLSAISGAGLDNVRIGVDGTEIPIMDGSAAVFFDAIMRAGLKVQDAPRRFIQIIKTVQVTDGDKWASFEPLDGLIFEFEIDFAHPAIQKTPQRLVFDAQMDDYRAVAPARTFGFLKDLDWLYAQNLAQGAGLDNAIVLDEEGIQNPQGLRMEDEFVRHKLLDAIGDLLVIGAPFLGRFRAYKSGHKLNNALLRAILNDPSCYKIVTKYEI